MADEAGTPHPHAGAVVGNDVVTVGEQRTGFEKKKAPWRAPFLDWLAASRFDW